MEEQFKMELIEAVGGVLNEFRLLQGVNLALVAAVVGLARACPNPEVVQAEIQRVYREVCAGTLGGLDDQHSSHGAKQVLDLLGGALGSPII